MFRYCWPLLVHKHQAFITHKHENLALNVVILMYLWNMSIESHSLTADVRLYLGCWIMP